MHGGLAYTTVQDSVRGGGHSTCHLRHFGQSGPGTESIRPSLAGRRDPSSKGSKSGNPTLPPNIRLANSISEEHQTLLRRVPLVSDVQAAWLLLVNCAGARANCSLRCDDPEVVEPFARRHDQDMLQCLSSILRANLPTFWIGRWRQRTPRRCQCHWELGSPQRTPNQQVSPLGKLG